MLSKQQRDKLRSTFVAGNLRVQSVSPEGQVEWKRVLQVHRNEVPWEDIYKARTERGPMVLTAGHRVFRTPTMKTEMKDLQASQDVLGVKGDVVGSPTILQIEQIPSRQFMFDLTAEDWHNFVLHQSGVVVSNSPDKFYHFRPPEFEGDIGQYNRIFGQIWEDAELAQYLERGLDWWNMHPPDTCHSLPVLDKLCTDRKCWREAVFWAAIHHACFALSLNWIADEFDYSIGGVSLSIEKSAKYQSMADSAAAQFDKAAEAKVRTVKFIRGLKQPRFGIGVRSAFGPYVGRGVLSPRSFI